MGGEHKGHIIPTHPSCGHTGLMVPTLQTYRTDGLVVNVDLCILEYFLRKFNMTKIQLLELSVLKLYV